MARALELVTFKTDPDRDADMLACRADFVSALRQACPGLIDVRMFRGEQAGDWIDVVFWESLEQATAAAETAGDLAEAQAFFSFITEPPVMVHGTLADEHLR